MFLYALALLPVLAGCRGQESSVPARDFDFDGDDVVVRADSPVARELKVEAVSAVPFDASFRTVGSVEPMAGHLAEVAVPFAGRITSALVKLGDYVRAGQPLFEMSSPEFYDAVREYNEYRIAAQTAAKNLERRETMHDAGIISEREMDETRAEAENARNALRKSQMALAALHVDTEHLEVGHPIIIKAPISGRIVECRITPGAYLKEDAEPLATIAELSRVWVTAQVKEAQVERIVPGETRAEVFRNSAPDSSFEGRIVYVGEMLDEETRSTEVVVECANPDRLLKPGMFVSVVFTTPQVSALVIPSTAVFQGEESKYVYVEQAESLHFTRRPVQVESAGPDRVHILSGLAAGDRIIASGGIYLSE